MADENNIPVITLQLTPSQTVPAPVDPTLTVSGQAADAKSTGDAIRNLNTVLTAAIDALFPVGAIYVSTLSTAPAFYGTWVEITMPMTQGDIEDGMRSYVDGEGTGTLHFWRRTA